MVAAGRDHRVPAVNGHGGLGRWAFLEASDPWHCMDDIRGAIQLGEPASWEGDWRKRWRTVFGYLGNPPEALGDGIPCGDVPR